MVGPHQTGADTCQCSANTARRKQNKKNFKEGILQKKWLIIPRSEWNTGIPYSELFHLPMELMKESRIWMLWNIFDCQMECKISDFGVILSGLRCHGQELSNCSTKQRLVLRAFYLIFFPSLQYYTVCWDIWSHCGKVMESPRMRWGRSGKLPATRSALHRGCVREVQDVEFHVSPLPECIRDEKCLCATYCSVQLITGWK